MWRGQEAEKGMHSNMHNPLQFQIIEYQISRVQSCSVLFLTLSLADSNEILIYFHPNLYKQYSKPGEFLQSHIARYRIKDKWNSKN